MNTLADGYPQIIPKINEHHVNRSVRRFEFRKTIARGVLELLDEIEARKQKVGKPGRSAHRSLVNKTDAQQLRELADGEILNACANRLPVIDRNNKEAIKRLIPKVVRLYFHNGHLNQLGGTDQDTIDSHSKRIARMLDEIIPK